MDNNNVNTNQNQGAGMNQNNSGLNSQNGQSYNNPNVMNQSDIPSNLDGQYVPMDIYEQTIANPTYDGQTINGIMKFNGKSLDDYITQGQQLSVVAVKMDGSEISLYKLSDGTVVDKNRAVALAEQGLISGCDIGHSKYGEPYLRGRNDGDMSNNLKELPKF